MEVHNIHNHSAKGLRQNLDMSHRINVAMMGAENVIEGTQYALSIRDHGQIALVIFDQAKRQFAHIIIDKTDIKKIARGYKQMTVSLKLLCREEA